MTPREYGDIAFAVMFAIVAAVVLVNLYKLYRYSSTDP